MTVAGAQMHARRPEPGRPASNTSPVGLWIGTLIALFLLIAPGAIVARITQLTWPVAITVGPALTYGVVALAIIPFGALGIPWNGWTALIALAAVCLVMTSLQPLLARYRDGQAETRGIAGWPALTVAAGVLLGALLIMWAAYRGLTHWQSIPSTWDAVWHANEVRFILDTGQASSTHMGELRNVETHQPLYYPSVFHALTAVFCQLTGAAPTTGYTLSSVAASVWLFPSSAAMLTWFLLRPITPSTLSASSASGSTLSASSGEWRAAGAAATSATMSASFTSVPYVEFGVAAMPNLGLRGRDPDVLLDHFDAAASRSHPGGCAGARRHPVGTPHRRVRRHLVPVGLVAFRRAAASGTWSAGRRPDPGRGGRADGADIGAAVHRGGPPG